MKRGWMFSGVLAWVAWAAFACGEPAEAAEAPEPTLADVAYGPHPLQVLDFWKAKTDKPAPLVFYIHGGGWTAGNLKHIVSTHQLADYLKAGVSVASINYRLLADAKKAGVRPPVRAPLHDAARALQFVRARAEAWEIDPRRIGLFGGSAGACSSLWLALHDDLADPASEDPIARESTRVACVAVAGAQTTLDPRQMRRWIPGSIYGAHAFGLSAGWGTASFERFYQKRERLLPWIEEYSPFALASADDPPVYLEYKNPPAPAGQPEKDPTHSAMFGVKFQQRLRNLGVECHLVYPGSPETPYHTRLEFLVAQLAKHAN